MKKFIRKFISKSKANLFISLALVFLIVAFVLDNFDPNFSYHDILVEFHGLVFDLFVFGILITIYESIKERKELIQRYQEELSDYRFWKSEESKYRTRGLIHRLEKLGVKEIDISHCYLDGDKSLSQYRDMTNWNFSAAYLTDNFFMLSNMTNANFCLANLRDSRFDQVNLSSCNFWSANLFDVTFLKCDLSNARLDDSYVESANWFLKLKQEGNVGIDDLAEKYTFQEMSSDDFVYYKIVRK